MPTTSVYGLPYQGLTDPPDGAALGQDLAEAVETELARIDAAAAAAPDAADTSATMGGAYTAARNELYRRGGWGFVSLTFNRPGSTMPGATGDVVATLPAGYRPPVDLDSTGATLAGGTLTVTITASGNVSVRPAAAVTAGISMVLSAVYPLA